MIILNNYLKKYISKIESNKFWANLFKNSFFAFIGDASASVIGLLVTIVLIKLIGSNNYGILVLAQSYMSIMDVMINIQSWKSVIQYGQKAIISNNISKLHEYIRLGIILDVSTAILGGIISFIAAPVIGKIFGWSSEMIICSLIFSITIFSHFSGTPTAILRLLNKFNLVALQKFLAAMIKIFSLLFMFRIKEVSLINVTIIYCITDIIGNFLLVLFAFLEYDKKYGVKNIFKSKNCSDKKEFINFTLWGTLSDIVDIPVNYIDVFIISLLGNEMISVFKVFKQLVAIIQKVMSPIQQSILPQFSQLSAEGNEDYGFSVVIKIRNIVLKLGIPFVLFMGITSQIWLKVIYGNIYSDNWYVLLLYLIVQVIALSYTTIHPYFLSLNQSKKSCIYVFTANVAYCILAIILVNLIGMTGIILAYTVQFSIVIYLKCKFIKSNINNNIIIKNKIIVIGGNHHNALGVVRALGERGIKSYAIITNDHQYAFLKKSKYIVKSYIVKEDSDEILKILFNEFSLEKEKTILIPTSDFAAITIDDNLDKLKEKFITPQINNHQGMIDKYMDKYFQYKLAKKNNILMAESYEFKLNSKINFNNFKNYPYIVKPIISAYGSKANMRICKNEVELKNAIKYCNSEGFSRVLVQEFIDYSYESILIGCAHSGKVILPGIVKKIRRYPEKYGTTAYAEIHKKDNMHNEFVDNIMNLLSDIDYSGMYDVEFFIKDNKCYLNEINFRNSGCTMAYCFDNVYLAYLWVLMVTGNSIDNEKQEITNEFSFIDEYGERNLLLEKSITFREYINDHRLSKGRLFHRSSDLKPSIYKNIYAVCRRIFK